MKGSRQTGQVQYPDFPLEEYHRRVERSRAEMDRQQVDAILLSQQENVRYFAGLFEVGWVVKAYFFCVLLPRREEQPPVLFVPEGDHTYHVRQSWIEDVRTWQFPTGFYTSEAIGQDLVNQVVAAVRESGLERGKLAVEVGAHFRPGLSYEVMKTLQAALPDVQWVDCASVLWPVRCIKSALEIERLRKACEMSCHGVRAGFEALEVGRSERDIANVMAKAMFDRGASEIRFLSLYAGPERAMWADSIPRQEQVLRQGSSLQFDGGAVHEGYFCDFKRMAWMGEPDDESRRFYHLARESLEAAISTAGPGVPAAEVYRASQDALREAGYGGFCDWCLEAGWSSIGHNVGLDIHEMPGISAQNHAPLQPGMVIALEPFISHGGVTPFWNAHAKYGLEDMVLVTEDGCEVLTKPEWIGRELWVA